MIKRIKSISHGLLEDKRPKKEKAKDYIAGASPITLIKQVLQPNGQWDDFLPPDEYQRQYDFDSMSCVSFSLNNVLEILYKRLFAAQPNFSDRFLAKMSGTTKYGNSLWNVVETARKKGEINEINWPWTPFIDTFEEYFASIPQGIINLGLGWALKNQINYEWADVTDKEKIMEALKYSPLQVTVGFNAVDDNGYYFDSRENKIYVHAVSCYGYQLGRYWKIFDHYDQIRKKARWDYQFGHALSVSLFKNKLNILMKFVKLQNSSDVFLLNEKNMTVSPIFSAVDYVALSGGDDTFLQVETIEPEELAKYKLIKKLFCFQR